MNRRGFLGSLAALCVAPLVPTPKPAPLAVHDHQTGIAIRFVRKWDAGKWDTRLQAYNDYRTDYRTDYRVNYHAERMT